jgi:HK97 family phage major capsid protein
MDTKLLNKRKDEILNVQESMLKKALEAKVQLTETENTQFENLSKELDAINVNISRFEAISKGRIEVASPAQTAAITTNSAATKKFYALGSTRDSIGARDLTTVDSAYAEGFWQSLKGGKRGFENYVSQFSNAVLGEGGTTADGSALVPISTDPSIPNLAMVECAARGLSRVITTEMDINVPYQSAKAVAAVKAETNNSGTGTFSASVPQFATTKLSAFMVGAQVGVSWELLQDSKALASFVTAELQRAITVEEETLFTTGSGSSQAQGYEGNFTTATGASITSGSATLGINPIIDLMGSLNRAYYLNAKFLVNRQEFNRLLKAQIASSQFQVFITFDPSGQARLFGYPVAWSAELPVYVASPATSGVWLFGDFASGAVIGDRGDSNIRIKVLDQVAAQNGQTVILGYRRSDQRIVLQEAVQQLNTNG